MDGPGMRKDMEETTTIFTTLRNATAILYGHYQIALETESLSPEKKTELTENLKQVEKLFKKVKSNISKHNDNQEETISQLEKLEKPMKILGILKGERKEILHDLGLCTKEYETLLDSLKSD